MLKVSEFKLEHLALMDDFEELNAAYTANPKAFEYYLHGPAYTVYCDEGIVIMGGLVIQYNGVAMAWAWPSKLIKKYPIYSCKIARWVISEGFKSSGLHKIFALIDAKDQTAKKWAEFVGLQPEVMLLKHGSNREDMIMYSAWREKDE